MTQSNELTIDQSDENKYPQGGYAPGNYYCNCSTCNEKFQGDKRSFQCEPCGTKSQAEWDALTPDEQAERVRRNIEIYREFENQQKIMKQSNNMLPAESKWKLTLHEQVERPYYEITNGPISLCASCGFVGETEEDEDAIFKNVAQVLNDSGIDFHSENALEFKQHIEIMQLQTDVDHWKREHQELQAQAQCMADALDAFILWQGSTLKNWPVMEQAHKALQQFKDGKKEVGPVKPVASNCGMCGKLGINQYLGNQLYLCDECFEDYEKGRDQPTIN